MTNVITKARERFLKIDSKENYDMIAHIRKTDGQIQTVKDHCLETSNLCAKYAEPIGIAQIARVQGLLHDIGKLTIKFEKYIKGETSLHRGEIDHSCAGAKLIVELAEKRDDVYTRDVACLIAHTILSHHGIHDWLDKNENDYMGLRLQKQEDYEEIREHLPEIIAENELLGLLCMASEEYKTIVGQIKLLSGRNKKAYAFYRGLLERFLLSCLIDADRANTAEFMEDSHTEQNYDLQHVWNEMAIRMKRKCDAFANRTDPISRQRCSISDRCEDFSKHPVGVCRLVVPTGGGKTLSSLRFAISYCQLFDKKRIIYTAPFMSILEQNSDEIRSIAGEAYFTEHHSNLWAEIDTEQELQEYELRTERWDSPVIATTLVQLLNTMVSAKSSSVRRFHRLADAVIIVDEVQSIPPRCVNLFNLTVNYLSRICGSTVVLCSATQPTVEETCYPMMLDHNFSMTGDTAEDFIRFKRTELIPTGMPYGMTYMEAAEFSERRYKENGNLLLIVNTKTAAKSLFMLMRERCPEAEVIHLSTNLCPEHRRERIREMKDHLRKKHPIICVTTQLIEAGVDISFRCVIRSLAGLDSAVQSAGRCNRNGESETPCPVYLVKLKEEHIGRLEGVSTAQKVTQRIISSDMNQDYLSYETLQAYYRELYHETEKLLSYPVFCDGIQSSLVDLLSLNRDHFNVSGLPQHRQFFVQAFKTAGSLFEVIDNNTLEVLVPYNEEAKLLIEELCNNYLPACSRELLRRAQKYTVNVYENNHHQLRNSGAVRLLDSGVSVLEERFYDYDYGIMTEGSEEEVLII